MVGIGYDIHRLVDKRDLYLGGVKFDFPKGLLGHSDGDVLLHAVCDALLGAANLGDIGSHFPPDDDRYKGIASMEILKTVGKFLRNSGFLVMNIDAVVIAESPKILPFAPRIRKNIASALGISEQVVSVKGKTNEGLGPVGEGRAISSFAICEIGRIYDTPEG
jgi:2-C-methyl-D-erythritol 2,4-cyclodiphosphate synthase